MRMRLCRLSSGVLLSLFFCAPPIWAQGEDPPEPAPKVMRFAERALAWYPDSIFRLISNTQTRTPSGSYRLVEVERTCASPALTGRPTFLVDEVANTIWQGGVGQLPPFQDASAGPDAIRSFLAGFLPEALKASMGLKVEISWDVGPRRPGAVIPLYLLIDSGYGQYRRQAAVTADAMYFVLGAEMALNVDRVAYRRRALAQHELVVWDAESGENAPLEIVEFSDLECPACRSKWPIINMVLQKNEGQVRHGMVSNPLTMIHPWAFRAASASWCVALKKPAALIPFKETFYSLQREMEVSLVTATSVDFITGRGLYEAAFRELSLIHI